MQRGRKSANNIIEQLYLGTLNPQPLADAQSSRTAELTARIVELEQQLTNRLLGEDKQLFLHLCALWSEQSGNDRISTFATAFQLAHDSAWIRLDWMEKN